MGLDTTHDCWHGAYSAFNRWRNKLAEVAGYSFFTPEDSFFEAPMIDWGHITHDNLMGKWEKTPDDPLIVLIVHSDCDGEIYPIQALSLITRLKELKDKLPDEDAGGHIGYWKDKTQQFIEGLEAAVKNNEVVGFH